MIGAFIIVIAGVVLGAFVVAIVNAGDQQKEDDKIGGL